MDFVTKTQNVVRSWKWIFWALGGMGLGAAVGYEEFHRQVPNAEITRELEGVMGTPGELKLLFTGDTGTGNSDQKDVALAMEKTCLEKKIDGVVFGFVSFDEFHKGFQVLRLAAGELPGSVGELLE